MRRYTSQEIRREVGDNVNWQREPIAKIGDIIHIRGYGNKEFEVFSVQCTIDTFPTESYYDICYDVVSLNGEEYILAFQEDITVVESPLDVDYERLEYLSERSVEMDFERMNEILQGFDLVPDDNHTEMEEDVVEESKTETVDDLLDKLNDYNELIATVGEDYEEGDGYYRRKVDDIKAKLRGIIGGK